MTRDARPPRWAEALLLRVLPPGTVGSSVKADLDQEFDDVVANRSAICARAWYAWEASKIAAHFTWGGVRPGAGGGRGGGIDRMTHNVRIALRSVRRDPGFSVVAIVTIALGIGANVAIFSVVNTVLLEPLPYADADRLVAIWEWNLARDRRDNVANPGNFAVWRDRSVAFREMTAISLVQPATITVSGQPDEAMMQYTSPDFFSVLGLEARLGRTFITELEQLETTEAIVSHRYWRRRFGGSPDVIGRTIQINSVPAVVVGVLPPEYVVFGEGTDLWVSIQIDVGDQTSSGRWLMVLGRLADDATLEVADAEMKAISAALADDFPDFNAGLERQFGAAQASGRG